MTKLPQFNPMSPDQIQRSIQTLTGECHAMFMFRQAVARAHPDPEILGIHFEDTAQLGLAHIEVLPMSDAMIGGYQHVAGALRKLLKVQPKAPPSSQEG